MHNLSSPSPRSPSSASPTTNWVLPYQRLRVENYELSKCVQDLQKQVDDLRTTILEITLPSKPNLG